MFKNKSKSTEKISKVDKVLYFIAYAWASVTLFLLVFNIPLALVSLAIGLIFIIPIGAFTLIYYYLFIKPNL